jgi:hypothetical protein
MVVLTCVAMATNQLQQSDLNSKCNFCRDIKRRKDAHACCAVHRSSSQIRWRLFNVSVPIFEWSLNDRNLFYGEKLKVYSSEMLWNGALRTAGPSPAFKLGTSRSISLTTSLFCLFSLSKWLCNNPLLMVIMNTESHSSVGWTPRAKLEVSRNSLLLHDLKPSIRPYHGLVSEGISDLEDFWPNFCKHFSFCKACKVSRDGTTGLHTICSKTGQITSEGPLSPPPPSHTHTHRQRIWWGATYFTRIRAIRGSS